MPKKTKEPKFPPPLNMSDDISDMMMLDFGVLAVSKENDEYGVFTALTARGHYDFLITQEIANHMVQLLRSYIAGESKPLVEDDD